MIEERRSPSRGWLYETAGDYHRRPAPDWIYTTTYERKMELVRALVEVLPAAARLADLGCGEGVFVEEAKSQGRNIVGLDLNYGSDVVVRGDVLRVPFSDSSFDLVLFLDVLEHLTFREQPRAMEELARIIAPGGFLLMTVPNLAHLTSRFKFLFRGVLDRSDQAEEHVGERPIRETLDLVRSYGFRIMKQIGITATVPFLYRGLFARNPARFRTIQDLTEPLAIAWPSGAMYVLLLCERD